MFSKTKSKINKLKEATDNDTINSAAKAGVVALTVYNVGRYINIKKGAINMLASIAETGVYEVALKSGAKLCVTMIKAD